MSRETLSPATMVLLSFAIFAGVVTVSLWLLVWREQPQKGVAESYKHLSKKQVSNSPFPEELTAEFMDTEQGWMANGPISDEQLRKLASSHARLSSIEMIQAQITASGLACLTDKHVRRFKLEQVALTPECAPVLSSFKELEQLNLSDPSVNDDFVCQLDRLSELSSLVLRGASITNRGLSCLSRSLPNLQYLDLSMCAGIDNSSVTVLKTMKRLGTLCIARTLIDEKGILRLARESDLDFLNLRYQPITDAGLSKFPLDKFNRLDLSNTSLSDESLKTVAKMKRLSQLDIVGCKGISPAGVKWLRSKKPKLVIVESDRARVRF